MDYNVLIERGRSPMNDAIIDFLKTKISGFTLDVGANTGWLISELDNAIGVDTSPIVVEEAKRLGRDVRLIGGDLPFPDKTFDTVVISCVLEQCEDWKSVLKEALRVCKGKVIGINPIPGSGWGKIVGWVKSVIPESEMIEMGAIIEYPNIEGKYYFQFDTKI